MANGKHGIDQDPHERLKFADDMIEFADNMQEKCKILTNHIEEARDNMKDASGQRALDLLVEHVTTIKSQLDGIDEYAKIQKEKAQKIIDAEDFFKF